MTKIKGARQLQRRHFAFMRAVLQGLDARASWDRYLRSEGESGDLRHVKRTVDWIRDAFAAAARRANRPGTARLVLMDPDRLQVSKALPSLEAFAAERGLEDFSEEEQAEAYQDAYPEAGLSASGQGRSGTAGVPRRTRLITRQLEALRWLESLTAQAPRPDDDVAAWLNPAVARRLQMAGLTTLRALVEAINVDGARWWRKVPGVGPLKAERVMEWLSEQEDVTDLQIGRHALVPRLRVAADLLDAVVAPSTALVPFEKLLLPPSLNGSEGSCRAPASRCRLPAADDHAAIGAWIAAKAKGASERRGEAVSKQRLSATQRSYRKEAERLLLWCILERKRPLSSMSLEDVGAYVAFLSAPPASWCGPRHQQRWSPAWRPLEGPLSPVAQRHALAVLRGLFAFLVGQGYLVTNPFAAVAVPAQAIEPLGTGRTLSVAQWQRLETCLHHRAQTHGPQRLGRAVRWLYATGVRLKEITSARCTDIEFTVCTGADGAPSKNWVLSVRGRTQRPRKVPVSTWLIEELQAELVRWGCRGDVTDPSNAELAILCQRKNAGGSSLAPWSPSGLYKAMKRLMLELEELDEKTETPSMGRATAQWLRHTHGAHALLGRSGSLPVPAGVLQNNLGHASLKTTLAYRLSDCAGRTGSPAV